MENVRSLSYLTILKRDWRKLFLMFGLVLLFGLIITVSRPFQYGSSVGILILQKSSFSIDAYSASKSEERVANSLGSVIYGSEFFNKVIEADANINLNYFKSDEAAKRKQWKNMIETDVPSGLSRLNITVYHKDPEQARRISRAIADILLRKDYISISDIDLRLIDPPLVSNYPVKPNVPVDLLVSLAVAIIMAVVFVIASYNPKHDKLFVLSKGDDDLKLIKYKNIPEDESVEEDLSEVAKLPEIKDLEEIEEIENEELEEEEDLPLAEPPKESKGMPFISVSESIEEKPASAQSNKTGKFDKSNLKSFSEENTFIGMKE